jgi:crossover junction endodeoxyribonuclease RuvC
MTAPLFPPRPRLRLVERPSAARRLSVRISIERGEISVSAAAAGPPSRAGTTRDHRAGRKRDPGGSPKNQCAIARLNHLQEPCVEGVGARPGEGAVGAFAFGRARGVIEGVLAAAGVPVTFIQPAAWKRGVGLRLASKDAARAEAIRRWPAHAELFARVKVDGRAESALIAVAGLMRKNGNPMTLFFIETRCQASSLPEAIRKYSAP